MTVVGSGEAMVGGGELLAKLRHSLTSRAPALSPVTSVLIRGHSGLLEVMGSYVEGLEGEAPRMVSVAQDKQLIAPSGDVM